MLNRADYVKQLEWRCGVTTEKRLEERFVWSR